MDFPSRLTKYLMIGLLAVSVGVALGPSGDSHAVQSAPEPRREQLLNGLPVLLWTRAGDPKVLVRLRIHSGAAFDLAGKAGMMSLLGDALFPDPTTREYFTEELSGRLEVTTDYDSIDITLAGPASEFERIIDQLRSAVNSPLPPAETVERLRDARSKMVRELGVSPTMIADRAIAARLYGEYPYGRAYAGTPETLAGLNRHDLQFARERFLHPNNSTLVIIGGVEERRAMRALRQLLGMWRKSDSIVPSTFRQPDAPDERTLLINLPGAETAEIRLATRALARGDRDYTAATLLALLARDRWQAALPELNKKAFFVRHEAYKLAGSFIMGASVPVSEAAHTLEAARQVIRSLAATPPSASELERVKSEAQAVLIKQTEQAESIAELWLDMETFKLAPLADQVRQLNVLTPGDVQRTAARLFRDAPAASVAVGSADQLRPDLERASKVEVLGATSAPQNAPPASTPVKSP